MIAAEQRLRDAGYGEKFLLTQGDDDDSELKIDDEIKVGRETVYFAEEKSGKGLAYIYQSWFSRFTWA